MVRALVLDKKGAEYSLLIAGVVLTKIQRIALGRSRGNDFSQFHEEGGGLFPAQTGIGNGDTMLKSYAFFPGLFAWIQVAFEHQSHDGLPTFTELPQNLLGDESLASMIFLGVVVRTVDHDRAGDAFVRDGGFGFGNVFLFVVGLAATTTQDDVAVGIPHGPDDRCLAVGIDADKVVGSTGRNHGIDGNLKTAFGPIFEPDWHGDTACHFAMRLAFCRTGTDRRPTNKVGDVLRADRIQQLRSAGKAQLIDLEENRSSQLDSGRDVAGPVQMGIVDQAFPADGGPWLFKVGSHHDQETVAQGVGYGLQLDGILIGGVGVMDGARSDDHKKPVTVLSMEDPANGFSGFNDQRGGLIGDRQFGLDGARRGKRLDFNNMLIVDRSIHDDHATDSPKMIRPGKGC